jgi:hypothetical protein
MSLMLGAACVLRKVNKLSPILIHHNLESRLDSVLITEVMEERCSLCGIRCMVGLSREPDGGI